MIPVMAQDTGGRTKFTTVYVTVLDINDNAPQFYASSMSYVILSGNKKNSNNFQLIFGRSIAQ